MPQRSVGLKLLLVCFLALLMAIPAMMVYIVVAERQSGANMAMSQVSEAVGGPQTLLGPVLAVPYARTPDPERPGTVIYGHAIAYAETGNAIGSINVEERKRGIHMIPVFEADLTFEATFNPEALRAAIPPDASPVWADARLYLGLSDTRGIKDAINVTVNNRAIEIEPAPSGYRDSGTYQPVPNSGVTLAGGKIDALDTRTEQLAVVAKMKVSGAQRFAIGPFAKDTSVSLSSNWEDPSFQGGVLPESHTASDDGVEGFQANWRVPYLARNIPGAGANINLSKVTSRNQRDMAIRFMREANAYQSVERALKYAAMFIGFVFLAYFLFEVTSNARAHPAQYVLVGLAQTIFYILLLAFVERIGFDWSFLIAAAMTVSLTSLYAASVFSSRAYGLRAFAILSGIYALIYVLMRAEGHALLAGALVSFAAIALTMYMTRNIDWYGGRSSVQP
jgi:inner membrane protein